MSGGCSATVCWCEPACSTTVCLGGRTCSPTYLPVCLPHMFACCLPACLPAPHAHLPACPALPLPLLQSDLWVSCDTKSTPLHVAAALGDEPCALAILRHYVSSHTRTLARTHPHTHTHTHKAAMAEPPSYEPEQSATCYQTRVTCICMQSDCLADRHLHMRAG